MSIRSILMAAALTLSFSGIAQAAESVVPSYRIDLIVSRDGALIGKPALVAEAGAEAELSVDSAKNPADAFRLLLTASPVEGSVGGKESVKIGVKFFYKSEGKWVQRTEHSVVTVLGEPLSLAFPPKPPETAGKRYDLIIMTARETAKAAAAK